MIKKWQVIYIFDDESSYTHEFISEDHITFDEVVSKTNYFKRKLKVLGNTKKLKNVDIFVGLEDYKKQ